MDHDRCDIASDADSAQAAGRRSISRAAEGFLERCAAHARRADAAAPRRLGGRDADAALRADHPRGGARTAAIAIDRIRRRPSPAPSPISALDWRAMLDRTAMPIGLREAADGRAPSSRCRSQPMPTCRTDDAHVDCPTRARTLHGQANSDDRRFQDHARHADADAGRRRLRSAPGRRRPGRPRRARRENGRSSSSPTSTCRRWTATTSSGICAAIRRTRRLPILVLTTESDTEKKNSRARPAPPAGWSSRSIPTGWSPPSARSSP